MLKKGLRREGRKGGGGFSGREGGREKVAERTFADNFLRRIRRSDFLPLLPPSAKVFLFGVVVRRNRVLCSSGIVKRGGGGRERKKKIGKVFSAAKTGEDGSGCTLKVASFLAVVRREGGRGEGRGRGGFFLFWDSFLPDDATFVERPPRAIWQQQELLSSSSSSCIKLPRNYVSDTVFLGEGGMKQSPFFVEKAHHFPSEKQG